MLFCCKSDEIFQGQSWSEVMQTKAMKTTFDDQLKISLNFATELFLNLFFS